MSTPERRLRDLITICEINLRLSSDQPLTVLLDTICFYATVLLEAERSTLLLIDEDSGKLVVQSCYGELPEGVGPGRFYGGAIAMQLATDAHVRFLVIAPEQRCALPFLAQGSQEGAIIAAILGKRGTIGVLAVEAKNSGEAFGEYDGEVLQMLVGQAGIAIENAKVYQSLDYLVGLRTQELEAERDRSEQLLLNVLPREVVDELQQNGSVQPRRFESASVLFTDFCSFTRISESMSPEQLLLQLEYFYQSFDEISAKHGLERLKTIGDAYMAVAGVPVARPDHAVGCVAAALEMVQAVVDTQASAAASGAAEWRVRVGVHTGPVVAGVVGKRRFAYDIWGDTVNVASRMQANSLPDRVNISAATHVLVKDAFTCEPRSLVEVKGKGLLQMYLVGGRR
jgi:adenylate cyclase